MTTEVFDSYQKLLTSILAKTKNQDDSRYFKVLILLIKTLDAKLQRNPTNKKELSTELALYLKKAFVLDKKMALQFDYVKLYAICGAEYAETDPSFIDYHEMQKILEFV